MSFPSTALLDQFNRADESPLSGGGNWGGSTGIFGGPTSSTLRIVSNQVQGNNPLNLNSSYWAASTFGPNCEAYATVATTATVPVAVYARLTSIGASVNGYVVEADMSANTMEAYRLDAGVLTLLGSTVSQTISNGDAIGISVIGNVITIYYKAAAGSWTALATRTDSTYGTAGNVGASIFKSSGAILDDFGGGTVVPTVDEVTGPRAVWTKQTIVPPRGESRLYVGTFEQTLFSFNVATFPRGATAPPTILPRRNATAIFQCKLADAGSQQEQESAWQVPVSNPGRPLRYYQPQSPIQRPVPLPPDPSADVSATRDIVIARPYRPFPSARQSLLSFVPLMQGPAPAWVKSQWQVPPVLRGKQSSVAYVGTEPLPDAARWLSVKVTPARYIPTRQSLAVNVFPQPAEQFAARHVQTGRTRTPRYMQSRATTLADDEDERLIALPIVSPSRPMFFRPPTPTSRAVGPQDVAVIAEELMPAVRIVRPTFFMRQRGPATRIAWVPQTIFRAREDDRDSGGADARNQSSTGSSLLNRTSTGVASRG